MGKLRFGVLGIAGHFTLRVLDPLLRSEEAELFAVASREKAKAVRFAARYGVKRNYGSYEDLLADEEVDAVYIPLPNHLHLEYIRKAADAGKHILCEKPLALDSVQAEEAVAYAKKKGVLLIEAFMYRFHPQWTRVREIALSGEIGTVRGSHCVFSYDNRDPSNIRNVLAFGGGALLDIGVYAVSSARFVMDAEPVRVVCALDRDPAFGTDVRATGILEFETGRSAFTVATQIAPNQRFEAFGSGGKIAVEIPFNMYPDVAAAVLVRTGVGSRELALEPADQYGLQIDAFARAIRGSGTLPLSPEDALANMRAIDALFRSARSGEWEKVGR